MLSEQVFLVFTLGGLGLMTLGAAVGFVTVLKMLGVINDENLSDERIPKWHAFVRPFSNDVIRQYRKIYNRGRLNTWLKTCWLLLGVGFAIVIISHFVAPKSL